MMGLNQRSLLPVVLMIALAGCGESQKSAEAPPLKEAAKPVKLTAAEAKQLAADTMDYFKNRRAQFSDDAVMNDDALRATFLLSKEFREISARWPSMLDNDAESNKFGHCHHLMLTAQSYADAMNGYAFKDWPEKLAKERRKDFKKDWSGCEAELAGSKPD